LDPENKIKRYDSVLEEYELNSFKRKNPETYLTVSLKDNVQSNNANIHYFQIIEPIIGITSSQLANQKLTMKEKWLKSDTKELFRLVYIVDTQKHIIEVVCHAYNRNSFNYHRRERSERGGVS